jgi:hypothetical protein
MGFFSRFFNNDVPASQPERSFRGLSEPILNKMARQVGGTSARVSDDGQTVSFNYNSRRGKPMGPIDMTADPDGHIADPGPWYPGQRHFPAAEFARDVNAQADYLAENGELGFSDDFMRDVNR